MDTIPNVTQVVEPKPTPSVKSYLGHFSTIVIPSTATKFVAKEKFVVNIKHNAPVKISFINEGFIEWFLSGSGTIEDPIGKQTLRYAKLLKTSIDTLIFAELGGKNKSETTLTELFYLMEKQKNGELGTLLNNKYANIFYVRDSTGVFRALGVRWGGGGWSVIALSAEVPNWWEDGNLVFSRNSVLEQT